MIAEMTVTMIARSIMCEEKLRAGGGMVYHQGIT